MILVVLNTRNKKSQFSIVLSQIIYSFWYILYNKENIEERVVDKEKKVIWHTGVFADIINVGDIYVPDESPVAVNNDLIIARSFADLEAYCEQYQFLWGTEDKSPYMFFVNVMGIERARRDFFLKR